MEAGTGQVSRVKVFTKSAVKPQSEYQLVYDSELYSKNILVDDTTSLIEYPIGIFNGNTNVLSGPSFYSSSFNAVNYWNVIRLNGAPSASKSTNSSYLSNAISILPTAALSGSQELMLEQTGSVRIPFWKDTSYTLKFDYYLTKNVLDTRDSKLDVYISGSSFVNNNELGYFLGSVPTHKGSLSIVRDYTIPIKPNSDGDGILRFVMRDGTKIANIRVQENVERGFSSNRTKLYVPITNEHKNEYLDFKIQFFNYTLKEANREFVVKNSFFAGGNQYIVGDTNIITGSTFVASYSSSGIELYGNISGSKSGSYISSYGYKGIEWVTLYPLTASNYGWSVTQGNPYSSVSYSHATVQMINQSGSRFEFRSNPDSFKFNAVGSNSTVLIGNSGSISSSYLKWDGTDLVVYASGSKLTTATGSFTGSFTGSGLFDYVTITGSVNATYAYAYFSYIGGPTPSTGVSSGTNPYSLTATARIQASEFNATSDERLKNIIGKIKLADAIRFINGVDSIQFTWKDEIDKGIKTGYSAQQLIKTGFEHMVGAVPKSGLEETVDNDGFISPKDTQLVVNTDQITAYHSLLIQHLLEKIEELEKRLLVSDN